MNQLTIYSKDGTIAFPVTGIPANMFYIDHVYGGLDTLSFDIDIKNEAYALCAEEARVRYGNVDYLIKTINERSTVATVGCELDLDAFKAQMRESYSSETQLLSTVLEDVMPDGWEVVGANLVAIRRSISLEHATPYDIIMEAQKVYGVSYRWETAIKRLVVLKPELNQPSGKYITPEINLKDKALKSSTSTFYTRIYPYGKDGLTIAAVNDGVIYLDNNNFSDKIISCSWVDERYTVAQNLKDDAIEKLKTLSAPVRSYTCTVLDLAAQNPNYEFLSFELYQVVSLIDPARKSRIDHMIVHYKEYPLAPQVNVITLSTVPAKIEAAIKSVVAVTVSQEIAVDRQRVNEIRRDVDTNTARISETYTKGETDSLLESQIIQSTGEILTEVSESYSTKGESDELGEAIDEVRAQSAALSVTVDGISASVSVRGGDNLIGNSSGVYGLYGWNAGDEISVQESGSLSSGHYFDIENSTLALSDPIKVVPGAKYSIYFKYKTTIPAGGSAKIVIGSEEYPLDAVTSWTEFSRTFTPEQSPIGLSVLADNASVQIGDIMLSEGLETKIWRQAPNETKTGAVTMYGAGLFIDDSGSDLRGEYTNEKVEYTRKSDRSTVAKFSASGAETGELVVNGTLTVQRAKNAPHALRIIPAADHAKFVIND